MEYYKKRPDLVKSDITCIWIAYHTSDPDLIIDLYGVTYPIIYQVAYNLSPLLADDLTSEVYLFFMARRGHKSMLAFRSFPSWFRKIVKNKCLEYLRWHHRGQSKMTAFSKSQEHSISFNYGGKVDQETLHKLIERLLASNHLQKEIIQHVFLGYPNQEIATRLGLTEKSVRQRKSRALKKVRGILSSYGYQ